jgi:hypothetical protein
MLKITDNRSQVRKFADLKEKLFEISNDSLDKREYNVVRIEDVDVGCSLAQLDAGDGRSLGHGLGAVRNERLFDTVDKLFLPDMLGRARRPCVGIVNLLQDGWS